MREALFYSRELEGIRCQLCPNLCLIEDGKAGLCRIRVREGEKLISKGYGNISAIALDPIEKKPLYHFFPGTDILSVGGIGCNLKCSFCQNWHIAHDEADTQLISPEELVSIAKDHNSIGIAFTYNEPIINYEYIMDTSILAKEHKLKIVLVTNGYILPKPLKELLPLVDAMNIDVKGFTQEYYNKVCEGSLGPVKRAVEIAVDHCHVELTTLVVGGVNDDMEAMRALFKWICQIDPNLPLHLTRYFPNYQMDRPATPTTTMLSLKKLGHNYLNYIYLGNILGIENSIYCPSCGQVLVRRNYHKANIVGVNNGKCNKCGQSIPIIL